MSRKSVSFLLFLMLFPLSSCSSVSPHDVLGNHFSRYRSRGGEKWVREERSLSGALVGSVDSRHVLNPVSDSLVSGDAVYRFDFSSFRYVSSDSSMFYDFFFSLRSVSVSASLSEVIDVCSPFPSQCDRLFFDSSLCYVISSCYVDVVVRGFPDRSSGVFPEARLDFVSVLPEGFSSVSDVLAYRRASEAVDARNRDLDGKASRGFLGCVADWFSSLNERIAKWLKGEMSRFGSGLNG